MRNYITRVNDIGCDNIFWNDTVFDKIIGKEDLNDWKSCDVGGF